MVPLEVSPLVDVNETLLPGVGIRYEFSTRSGARVGLVARRDGRIEIVAYDPRDPDVGTEVMTLTASEAETVAELLGGPRIAARFADLTREIPGLTAAELKVTAGSRYAGRLLGDTRARTRTGASIVALVRGADVIASPGPEQQLDVGDTLVVVGTSDGIDGVRDLLARPTG